MDISGDISDPALRRDLKARNCRCLLLANPLEHVRDRSAAAAACKEIVGSGGLILATAPSSYPYRADPFDSLYRPSPDTLAALFRRSDVRLAEEVSGGTYGDSLLASGSILAKEAARTLLWPLIAPLRPRSCLSRIHRWFWYARPPRVSIVLLCGR